MNNNESNLINLNMENKDYGICIDLNEIPIFSKVETRSIRFFSKSGTDYTYAFPNTEIRNKAYDRLVKRKEIYYIYDL